MKQIFVKDVSDGGHVRDTFLVKRKTKGVARNGKPYLTVILSDKTADIEGRIWDNAGEFDKLFESGDFVKVDARGNLYQNKVQLNITDIYRVEAKNVDLADYIKTSKRHPDELIKDIRAVFGKIRNGFLKKLVFSFLDDEHFEQRFKKAPAAKTVHHAYVGGLAEHVLSLANLALKVSEHYKELNCDLLLAGVFFHDIGKTREISPENSFEYTDEGKLIGHLVLGCEMIEEKIKGIKDFPRDLATIIKHLVVSHHGTVEFGSPKAPQILEALVLNLLDDMDSKIKQVVDLFEQSADKSWSDFSKFLGREFYKTGLMRDEESQDNPIEALQQNKKAGKSKKKGKTQAELELFK